MKLNHLILVGDAVEKISEITDCGIPEIVDGLTGLCWDEEDASQIKNYHATATGAGDDHRLNPGDENFQVPVSPKDDAALTQALAATSDDKEKGR